jgi:anti-anti-sigma factor
MLLSVHGPHWESGEVHSNVEDDALCISINGHFGVRLSSEVREVIKEGLDTGIPMMIIDMRRVDYIDSSGIGTLVMAWKSMTNSGGKLQVLGVPEQARRLLRFPPFAEDGLLNPEIFRE